MYRLLILCAVHTAFAKELCLTPSSLNGTCKPIKDCDILLKILTKSIRTAQDEHYLRQSQCGFEGSTPKVCCPDSVKFPCITLEGKPGECVPMQSCPHLVEMTKDPSKTNVQYVKDSACVGPEDNSVCCGPQILQGRPKQGTCEDNVSAFPPDSESNCCGIDETIENKIIRGSATYVTQYPWLVVIEYIKEQENPKLLCGGALISGKYVLTAAHCVTGVILQSGTPKNVRLGEYNVTNEGPDCEYMDTLDECTDGMVRAPIEETIPHPEYDGSAIEKHHDIALIRLKINAPYTDYIRPICLPREDYVQALPTNFVVHVAGWGLIHNITDNDNIFRGSDVKRHMQLPYVARDKCQAAFRTLHEDIAFTDGHICSGNSDQGSYKGDSGGPLMYNSGNKTSKKYEVVGILSTAIGGHETQMVFTYVHKYLPWIKANIKP